ncbi:MAG TPA: hypothetical protein VMW01_07690 [Williamwhitmania sp.]|nr:hypothetical protein [Williamwhitmania sp.]
MHRNHRMEFSITRILDRNAIKILQINSYPDEVIAEALEISKTFGSVI